MTAVVGPAPREVGAGVPGQSSRLASLDRNHVDVGVAVVLAGEGHQGPVRRQLGSALDALKAGQPPRGSAIATDDPQVGGIGEDDMLVADVRLTQQLGLGAERGAGASQGQPYGDEQADPHNAISSWREYAGRKGRSGGGQTIRVPQTRFNHGGKMWMMDLPEGSRGPIRRATAGGMMACIFTVMA